MPIQALIPYAVIAAQTYFSHRNAKNKEKQARREYEDELAAQRNDPRTLLRTALVNDLFKKHPEWETKYPGLRDRLNNPSAMPFRGGVSIWDAIGQGVTQAGQYYVANRPKASGSTRPTAPVTTSSSSDAVTGAGGDPLSVSGDCPPGQVFIPFSGCE